MGSNFPLKWMLVLKAVWGSILEPVSTYTGGIPKFKLNISNEIKWW